jgi:histidine decarboxylase
MYELPADDAVRLNALHQRLITETKTYIGYPNSKSLNHQVIAPFLDLPLNNVGDPFLGNNGPNTCELECEVLEFYRDLLNMEQDNFWGYVTNGGTEANLYGLYLARETYPNGIVYHSEEAHYSIPKAVKLLRMRSQVIGTSSNGEIRYPDLRDAVKAYRDKPAIIAANIGTTMKGAIDQVEKIMAVLRSSGVRRFYIHCDAALFGAYLPFVDGAPSFDFRLPVGSIAISGHKFLGSAIPCGVVLARKTYVNEIRANPEYIASVDDTISGSRDGFSVLVLWHNVKRFGKEGMAAMARECLDNAQYTLGRLREIDWPAWVNPWSNIVVIARPCDAIVKKWQLAAQGTMSHVVVMPGVSRQMLDAFVDDVHAAMELEKQADHMIPRAA